LQIHTISTWHATTSSTKTSAALACMFTLLDLAGQYKNKKRKQKISPRAEKFVKKRKKKQEVKARKIWAGGALLYLGNTPRGRLKVEIAVEVVEFN